MPVSFYCYGCSTSRDVLALREAESELSDCCRNTLIELANHFSMAVLRQAMLAFSRTQSRSGEFNDAVADAAMLSPNKDVRQAAIRYRNEKNRDQS